MLRIEPRLFMCKAKPSPLSCISSPELTGLDSKVNGFLLNDGAGAREVCMADIIQVVV